MPLPIVFGEFNTGWRAGIMACVFLKLGADELLKNYMWSKIWLFAISLGLTLLMHQQNPQRRQFMWDQQLVSRVVGFALGYVIVEALQTVAPIPPLNAQP